VSHDGCSDIDILIKLSWSKTESEVYFCQVLYRVGLYSLVFVASSLMIGPYRPTNTIRWGNFNAHSKLTSWRVFYSTELKRKSRNQRRKKADELEKSDAVSLVTSYRKFLYVIIALFATKYTAMYDRKEENELHKNEQSKHHALKIHVHSWWKHFII